MPDGTDASDCIIYDTKHNKKLVSFKDQYGLDNLTSTEDLFDAAIIIISSKGDYVIYGTVKGDIVIWNCKDLTKPKLH